MRKSVVMRKQSSAQSFEIPTSPTKRESNNKVYVLRKLRKYIEVASEYLWQLSRSVRSYRVEAVIVAGKEKYSRQYLKAFYIGHYDNFSFIFSRIYSEFEIVAKYRNISSFSIRKWIKRYKDTVDLIVTDVELLFCKMLPGEKFIEIPQWVKQRFEVPDSWEAVLNSICRKTKKEVRRLLKHGYTYKITSSNEDFKIFYHRMYVPYIKKRFGDEAIIVSEDKFLRKCYAGELMELLHEQKLILCVLLSKVGRLSVEWVGVPDDIEPEELRGASDVLDYLTILYGYECGYHTIDFGPSRPLLNDGLFRYKRKWGTYIQESQIPRGDILLKPLRFDAPLISFFTNNHFITRDGKKLVGRILFGDHKVTTIEIEHCLKHYFTKGLSYLKIFSLSGFDDEVEEWAKVNSKEIRLFDLSRSSKPEEEFCCL